MGQWRTRFIERRMTGRYDDVRPGKPRTIELTPGSWTSLGFNVTWLAAYHPSGFQDIFQLTSAYQSRTKTPQVIDDSGDSHVCL